jgi:hypothetical protein
MQTKWYFDKFAEPYLRNKEVLSLKELNQIEDFVNRLVPVKMKQKRFLTQNPKWVKHSFYNGYMSEIAIENYTGTKFIHWKIRDEKESDISDLEFLGLKLGVKTAEYGNLPLVYDYPKTPEIITIIEKPNIVYVIGYATRNMLDYYKSKTYGFGKVMNIKSGFWGFHKLYEFKSMNDLKMLYDNVKINNFNDFKDTVKDYPGTKSFLTFDF